MTSSTIAYPFSFSDALDEAISREAMNQFPDQIACEFDPNGAQDNFEIDDLEEENIPRPETNFDNWDEKDVCADSSKIKEEKFQSIELWNDDYLLHQTRNLADEQRAVLQKVIEFAVVGQN